MVAPNVTQSRKVINKQHQNPEPRKNELTIQEKQIYNMDPWTDKLTDTVNC